MPPRWEQEVAKIQAKERARIQKRLEKLQLKEREKEEHSRIRQIQRLARVKEEKKESFVKEWGLIREKAFQLLKQMEEEKIFHPREIEKKKEKLLQQEMKVAAARQKSEEKLSLEEAKAAAVRKQAEEKLLLRKVQRAAARKRIKEIFIAIISGGTLLEVGTEYSISRERVRQIVMKEYRRIQKIGFQNVIDIMDDNKHKGLPLWYRLID